MISAMASTTENAASDNDTAQPWELAGDTGLTVVDERDQVQASFQEHHSNTTALQQSVTPSQAAKRIPSIPQVTLSCALSTLP